MSNPDYTQVAEKLREYDRIWQQDVTAMNGKQTLDWMDKLDEAEDAVKSAFADATSHINSHDNAMLIGVGKPTWAHPSDMCALRQWLKRDGLYHGNEN